jgi:hypothetical protein
MDTDCEKSIMIASEKFQANSPDTLIEAKLSRIPKAFSIENLIAKKSKTEVENDHQMFDGAQENFMQQRIPPIAFSQNFHFYHPWAANYLMSQTNIPPNLLLNSSPQQMYQNDKLTNLMDTQAIIGKEKFPDFFNPHGSILPPDQVTTYLHHDQVLFNNKLKDTTFLNEFYSNYFMTENNRLLSDNNNVKRTKKSQDNVASDSCNNDSNSEFDVGNDNNEDSYSDLSVTMSPEHSKVHQDKGVLTLTNSPNELMMIFT